MTVTRMWRGVMRRAAMLPLRVIDAETRAEAITLLSANAVARLSIAGTELCFFAPSPLLRSRAASVVTKEPDMIAWLKGLGQQDVLWDVGSNVGVFSVYAAAVQGCRVIAFEPSAANFPLSIFHRLQHLIRQTFCS